MNKAFTTDLKSRARAVLLGKWAFLAGAVLLGFLLQTILYELVGAAFPFTRFGVTADGSIVLFGFGIAANGAVTFSIPGIICRIITELFVTILSTGSMFLYLNICRGKNFQLSDIFYGFSHRPEHIAGYFAVMAMITVVFSIIPSILLAMLIFSGNAFWVIGLVILLLACLAGYLRFTLGYAMFPFLYADAPWKTSRELLRESVRLMDGYRLRYFRLQLSFIGIALLGVLSFGIGTIWIQPYIITTNTQFYLSRISDEDAHGSV